MTKHKTEDYKNSAVKYYLNVKPENYRNYFQHAYGMTERVEYTRKASTRRRKLKIYK